MQKNIVLRNSELAETGRYINYVIIIIIIFLKHTHISLIIKIDHIIFSSAHLHVLVSQKTIQFL